MKYEIPMRDTRVYEEGRRGGKRKDRCFKVYLNMPKGFTEEDVMEFIESAVTEHRDSKIGRLGGVSVKRLNPLYSECK